MNDDDHMRIQKLAAIMPIRK